MDEVELGWMLRSFYRRERFKADVLATTVVEALAKAMGAKQESAPTAPAGQRRPATTPAERAAPGRRVVPAHEFFKLIAEP